MGYIRAEEILPNEVIEMIQQYADGTSIYIPRKQENRQEWGTNVNDLANRYYLSEKSIQRIIRQKRLNMG